jgi:hypothetical protein
MTTEPQCYLCRHRFQGVGRLACSAYPDRIPDAIALNQHDHHKPFDGDKGIRFEPIPDQAAGDVPAPSIAF